MQCSHARWILKRLANVSVPRVPIHGVAVDPDGRAFGRAGRHLHLFEQHFFVIHWLVLRPTVRSPGALAVAPVEINDRPGGGAGRGGGWF